MIVHYNGKSIECRITNYVGVIGDVCPFCGEPESGGLLRYKTIVSTMSRNLIISPVEYRCGTAILVVGNTLHESNKQCFIHEGEQCKTNATINRETGQEEDIV